MDVKTLKSIAVMVAAGVIVKVIMQKIDEAKAKKESDTVRELESQHFDLQQEYLQLIEELEKKYPDYHQLKYSTQTATVQTLQQFLKSKEKLLLASKEDQKNLLSYYEDKKRSDINSGV